MVLGVLMERDNRVRQAGGFIIQLMPFAQEQVISRLEENLGRITSVTAMLDGGDTPEEMLGKILEGLSLELTDKMPVAFSCHCSRQKIEKVLLSLGEKELQEMIQEGHEIGVECHFCNQKYVFQVDELEELMSRGRQ